MPVRIEVCPTVREPDGVALSSRNILLSRAERRARHRAAPRAGHRSDSVAGGRGRPAARRASAVAELASAGIEPEYFELVPATRWRP